MLYKTIKICKNVHTPSKKPKSQKIKEKKVKARKEIIESIEISCPFCNTLITSDQKFCTYCGTNLRDIEKN